jgi:DHA1 family bicyclomycin/chloramphenicol resistance-like MFS transporter
MIVALGLLSTFGPISLDLYLPALPQLADELGTSTSAAQLSITACLVGLSVGQVLAGPLSDRLGRRRPLVVGLAAYALMSLACAVAPSVELLVLFRLLQGFAGAAGLVIARAVARDLYSGGALLLFLSRLMLISGLAPVLAPVIGGLLNQFLSWRGLFAVLAGFGVVLLLVGAFGLRETLPPERRRQGGLAATAAGFRELLGDRLFVGAALCSGLVGASMFAYIAGSTFVLQRLFGMSPQGFSLVFGVNSLGIMAMSQLAGVLARRGRSAAWVLSLGLGLNLAGASALVITVVGGLGLPLLLSSLFVMVSANGLVFPTTTTLALTDYPHQAGTASSLLGLIQFFGGAVAAPLVGIAGETTAIPLGVVALVASLGAMTVLLFWVRPAVRRARRPPELGPAAAPGVSDG